MQCLHQRLSQIKHGVARALRDPFEIRYIGLSPSTPDCPLCFVFLFCVTVGVDAESPVDASAAVPLLFRRDAVTLVDDVAQVLLLELLRQRHC